MIPFTFAGLLANILPILGSSAILTILVQLIIQKSKNKTDIETKKMEMDNSVKIHTDDLAIKLLEAAEKRVVHWQEENVRLTSEILNLKKELKEAQTAISHLKKILYSSTDKEKTRAEENARVFLTKIDEAGVYDK